MKKITLVTCLFLLSLGVLCFNAHTVMNTFSNSLDLKLSKIIAFADQENEWAGWVKGKKMGTKLEWTGFDVSIGFPPSISGGLGFTARSCCVKANESTACNKSNEEPQCKNL